MAVSANELPGGIDSALLACAGLNGIVTVMVSCHDATPEQQVKARKPKNKGDRNGNGGRGCIFISPDVHRETFYTNSKRKVWCPECDAFHAPVRADQGDDGDGTGR